MPSALSLQVRMVPSASTNTMPSCIAAITDRTAVRFPRVLPPQSCGP
jgi:hypothetical protein